MSDAKPHLRTLEEIEREGIPGLVEVLRKEGIDAVRHVLWDATGWHRDYSLPARRNRATEEQKKMGWEMAVRMERSSASFSTRPISAMSKRRWIPSPRGRRASTGE